MFWGGRSKRKEEGDIAMEEEGRKGETAEKEEGRGGDNGERRRSGGRRMKKTW